MQIWEYCSSLPLLCFAQSSQPQARRCCSWCFTCCLQLFFPLQNTSNLRICWPCSARLVPTPSGNCPVNAFPLTIQQCQGCPPSTAGAAAVPAAVKTCAKYPSLFFFHLNSYRLSLHNTVTQGCLAHTGLCVLVCTCLLIHTGQPFHLHLFYSSTAGLLGFFFLNLLLSQTLYFQRSAAHAFIRVCGQQVDMLVLLQTTS